MGLDIVEFVMAVEDSFETRIPDRDAEKLTTPRKLIDYLHGQLPQALTTSCLSQRAYYILRREVRFQIQRDDVRLRPSTKFDDILSENDAKEAWHQIGDRLRAKNWSSARPGRWLSWLIGPKILTLGDAGEYLATYSASRLKRTGEGWTWNEVAWVTDRIMRDHLAINEYSLDDRFVQELGLD
jgi:hypothetical protein